MNVVCCCNLFIPSFKLCGDSQLEFLAKENKVNYRARLSKDVSIDDLIWLDVLMVVRGDSGYELSITKWCKNHGKAVIYVLDDNILEIGNGLATSSFYADKKVNRRIRTMIKYASGFVSPSKKILSRFALPHHKTLQIIEPALYTIQEKNPSSDGKIHIGFAGSIDRGRDIDNILYDTLKYVHDQYKDKVVIELFGVKTKIAEELNIVEHPFLDSYEKYQEAMKEYNWDIGLAPLPESEFHTYKHFNKLVEYSSFGIAGIYSHVVPYTEAVKDEVNGIYAENNATSWKKAVDKLINDVELRKKIQSECIKEAGSIFSLKKASEELYDYLNLFNLNPKHKINKISLYFMMNNWKIKNVLNKVAYYKWKTPGIILRKIFVRKKGEAENDKKN